MTATVAAPAVSDPTIQHRLTDTVVTVLGTDGRPLADADVTVQQQRHEFQFGNIGFDFIPLANGELDDPAIAGQVDSFGGASLDHLETLEPLWLELFNAATLPFYWGAFEAKPGHPDTRRLRRTAEWFRDRGVAVKGHPLVWHTLTAPWLLGMPVDEIERAQRERIRRDVADFAGLIDTWGAINEVVIMPDFTNGDNGITELAKVRGRTAMVGLAFGEARATNPHAFLLINDFIHSEAYERVIEDALAARIRIDAIGIQTHMHQGYRGEEHILGVVDRFARFGLPIHMTETTILSGDLMPKEIDDLNDFQVESWPSTPEGEERQAEEVVRHYRSLVGHPAVEHITYWGLTDDGSWLGAPVGFVRADASPKPSFFALRDLVKGEWWVQPTTVRTDADGRVDVHGFAGHYRVDAAGASATVALTRGRGTADARLG